MQPRPRVKKLRLAAIVLGLSLLASVSTVFGMMMAVAADLPDIENRAEFQDARNSVLTDVHGAFLGELTTNEGRILVSSDDIALAMQHAIVAIEDRRFYQNPGVDLRGIARALVQDVLQRRAAQGGSTIAQQFVKNALDAQDDRTVFQKLREAAMAFHLNQRWNKDKILEQYLNSIYFGNGAYGIESAARTYFGRDVNHAGCGPVQRRCAAELKPHESALLAGVVASPGMYDPVTRPAAAKRRRDLVLLRMREQGYLTPAEERRAVQEPLPVPADVRPPAPRTSTPGTAYFASWVRQQIADRYGPRRAFEGGLEVRTTLDLGLQKAAEGAVGEWLGGPGGPSASLVAIDNDTGEVRAMVGGDDFRRRPFNLATQGQRQPGSVFKPFVLATALERGIGPGSVWNSAKQALPVPGRERFVVNNYEDSYLGPTTLAQATTFSDNAVYAQVGLEVGRERIARTARQLGVRTPVSRNPAMILGGLEEGVTVLDMAHAYASLAAGGLRVSGTLGTAERGPVAVRRVVRRDDRDQVVDENRRRARRALPEAVAAQTRQLLQSVVTAGTGRAADLGAEGVTAWGKTGTTENYGDAWFVGATDSLTVAVWVGYPDRLRPMETEWRGEAVAGGTYPASIWRTFMISVLERQRRALEEECRDEEAQASARCVEAGLGAPEDGPEVPDPTAPAVPATPEAPAQPPTAAPAGDPALEDDAPQTPEPAPAAEPAPAPGTPAPDAARAPEPVPPAGTGR